MYYEKDHNFSPDYDCVYFHHSKSQCWRKYRFDNGDIIYEKRFLGISFYDYGRPWYIYVSDPKRGKDMNENNQKLSSQVADSLQKADILYLKKRMNDFFEDDRFTVNPMAKLDKKNLNEFHYDGISGDPTVIGFKIQLYVEGFEMIAYSKKMKKVQ